MKNYNYLTQNSKIAKMTGVKTYNWGIPAYRAADGFKTCPNAAACAIGCYAKSGAYLFSNVAQAFEKRLALTQSSQFVRIINEELKRRKVQRLRIHDSGDFYDLNYTENWFKIIQSNPHIEFYAYTKMVSMFKNMKYSEKPSNLTIIYSFGGTEDKKIDVNKDRHSRVFETLEQLQAAGYADASKDDSVALGVNPKIGLVYHGNKNYSNTNWSKVLVK
jgi:hypothetical protein